MSEKVKKFGSFAGVFTPSILTILGVIMYMRLGWVTGVAGLWGTLAVILLAHVISITTGLSISSIATDKKIEAGGIYYLLSRSLGLPMGGSIGITLFVGTALSISLYIVGFTENFLSIGYIQELTGITQISINDVRIIGSLVLVILVIIAFISTNVAIKSQFFILGAIALSLISLIIGLIINHQPPTEPQEVIKPFHDFSFEQVFAIFFPAVTGFTAGVAMSGDLKNPKKDIPRGTLLSISVGLIVYVALAITFYFFVDQQLLIDDYNVIMALAWIPALVIAGLWGATLSSALGGILGGPRIIQAIAQDKIVPKILGKGYGVNNEPRNALIFTFLISEIGILIGDLNIIAGVVTMFYLTAYGFINLAFALEKWASTDFRPSFKISLWVGIIGFFASFFIMFQLDVISMFGALAILGVVYHLISRKQLNLEFGDVWQSVGSSVLRKLLTMLSKSNDNIRNWRPNILLFSGGTSSRPYLIEFGKSFVGNYGLISNFILVLNKTSKVLFPKHKQALTKDDDFETEGVFTRLQECNNIYKGIESISATYGFSGVEPNTVILGWGRETEDPYGFAKMYKHLCDLDLNIVMLDYDKDKKFGNYKNIDIWWRGGSNNGNLILSLIKHLRTSYNWRHANIRILLINYKNSQKQKIYSEAKEALSKMRMDAEVKIINNQKDRLPVNQIIKKESENADLIFLGLAEVTEGKEEEFIERADSLYQDLGTIALVKASSYFEEMYIGV